MGMDAGCDLSFGVHVKDKNGWSIGNPFFWSKQKDGDELLESEEDLDLGEYLALKMGLVNPYEDAVANPDYDSYEGWTQGKEPADWEQRTSNWYKEQRRLEEEAPIVIVHNGSTEGESGVVIAMKGFHYSGDWEKPTDLGGESLVIPSGEAISSVQKFCEEYDIFPFDNPSWLLSANYG